MSLRSAGENIAKIKLNQMKQKTNMIGSVKANYKLKK